MKNNNLFIAGMLISTAWSLSAHSALMPASACKVLFQKGLNPPPSVCAPINQAPAQPTPPPVVSQPTPPPPAPVPPVVTQPTPPPPAPPIPSVDPIPAHLAVYKGPARTIKRNAGESLNAANERVFAQYCKASGGANSATVPQPNYGDPEVKKAATILSQVADVNFYFYGDVLRIYRAQAPKPSQLQLNSGVALTDNAHYFLVQTCGEFRDRAEMIEGKINWVNGMVLLENAPQQKVDLNKNIWSQLSARSYMQYIGLSSQVFGMRAQRAAANQTLMKTLHPEAQEPVEAYSICETKYLISKYIADGKQLSSLSEYESGLRTFEKSCSTHDNEHVFDFRGDSNFKQYSPEANAMLWHAISIARFCKSPTEANGKSDVITDQVCKDYFTSPFLSRYSAARSGLAAWLNHSDAEAKKFENQGLNATVIPSFDIKTLGKVSFRMQLSDGSFTTPKDNLKDATLGFNDKFGIGTNNPDLQGAFERLRNAMNRHTNWYKSSYNDQLGHSKSLREQAYSPFVASSYDMSASNAFTECGYTVQCDGDGRKAWMLVFKIKKDNWYNTRSLAENQKIDFDRMWIDETTFGTDHLADTEKAFDRLGTALEDELDTVIYLHNLSAGSGEAEFNDVLKK
jgi:hypothetical protein